MGWSAAYFRKRNGSSALSETY